MNNWGSLSVKIRDNITLADRAAVAICLVAVLVFTFPHVAAANTALPMVFEVENLGTVQETKVTAVTAETQVALELIPDPRIAVLRNYLATKNSPMAEHAATLFGLSGYKFIISIAFAESNFCKYNIRPYNCWGIGGGYPEEYRSYPEAFQRANDLIQRYHDQGMNTPAKMRNTWVGWHNQNWIVAVEQVMGDLESLGL